MKSNPEYDQTRLEFEDEWSRNKIEDLVHTNNYKRAREERRLYEHYLPKNELILEAGCGLGPKVIYFKKRGFHIVGVDFVHSALKRLKQFDPSTRLAACDIHDCPFPNNSFGAYLNEGWNLKKKFASNVSSAEIDNMYAAAMKNGALGGKITGAGGGGFMYLFCEFDKKLDVVKAIKELGGEVYDFSFDLKGYQTWRTA